LGNVGAEPRPAARSGVDPGPPFGDGLIGEIPGHGFLAGEHAREVATLPGSTWHRLVTDPLTGHAVERSSQAYRPDKAMVEHVRAVDRFCRAPGCVIPAHRCELDHEHPYGTPGGVTSVANLNAKHSRHHQFKTEQFWSSVMDETRQVTWTTLFKRVYTTQPHDHRQYAPVASHGDEMADPLTVEDPDLRDRLIYAALCSRGGQDRWLEALDDTPEHPDSCHYGLPLGVFHRRHGRRRNGPPPGQRAPEQILTPEPEPNVTTPPARDYGPPPF
ncbi:MAG: HNH endonuclease signature motif containing protein, partial [Ornithinimicrobium sp.]